MAGLRRPPARHRSHARISRCRPHPLPRCRGRLRPRRRRARGLRPHLPAGGIPHRRRTRARAPRSSPTSTARHRRRASTRMPTDRWVRLDEHAQAKVEAASLALVLDMTRPWIWDRLDALTQERVIAYLSPVVGDATYPQDELALVPRRRADVPPLGRRAVVGAGHRRRPGAPRRAGARGRLDLGRLRALVRPLRGLGAAHLPRAVVAHAGRRRARRRPHPRRRRAPRPLPAGCRRPRGRRRLAARAGSQPHLPLRGGGALLGRRARRGALGLARAAAPRRERRRRALRRAGRPRRGRRPHHGLAPRVARARAVVLRTGLAVLGRQGPARHLAAGRPPGVGRRDRAAARSRRATSCAPCVRPAG